MRVCLVLGAGASVANAAYFRPQRMQDTHPPLDKTFFQTVEARNITLSGPLRRYLSEVMGLEPTLASLRDMRMEELFRDVFFDFQETPSDRRALGAYVDLIDLYLRVLRETTNWLAEDGRRGAPIGRLLAAAARAEELTIITFNHDLVIENEIARRATLQARWCLDRGYGSFGEELALTVPTSNLPVFNLHRDGLCDHGQPLTILKLHGSLNWVVRINSYRPTAGVLSGPSGSRTIHLSPKRRITAREIFIRQGQGRTQWQTWPVVVPPVYTKQALRQAVHLVWEEARSALEAADRVAVFGYSLPVIDIEAEKLIERGLANSDCRWVDVINPDPASAQRYASLAGAMPVRWYPNVEDFFAGTPFTDS